MTLTTTTSRNDYIGTGTTGPFAYGFKIFAATDLEVTKRDATTGAETTLAFPGDYAVTGVGARIGGSITLTDALAAGDALTIRRVRPLTQATDFRNQGAFFPENQEDALDHLVMIDQQQQDEIDRSMRLAETVNPADVSVTLPLPIANRVLAWNNLAKALENRTLDSLGDVAIPGDGRTVATLTDYLAHNAVFNVWDYAPDGVLDRTALQAAIDAALASSLNTKAPAVVDLAGATVGLESEVTIGYAPYGLRVRPGRISALPTFPVNQFLVRTGATAQTDVAGMKSEDLQFLGVVFDAAQRGGCLQLDGANRPKVIGCEFWHYSGQPGLQTITSGHELRLIGGNFGQYFFNEYAGAASTFTGTGIDLNTHDNMVIGTVIQLSAVGIRNNATFNQFNLVHVWTGTDAAPSFQTKGIYCTAAGIKATFTNCYIDSCQIVLDNPWQAKFNDCLFLVDTTDATFGFVRLKPLAAGLGMQGVSVRGSIFHNNQATLVNSVFVDTSVGTLDATAIKRCDFSENEFSNVSPVHTRIRLPVALAAAAAGNADFTPYFPVGAPQVAMVSVRAAAGTPACVVSGIAGQVVSLALSAATTGTAYVEADINTSP